MKLHELGERKIIETITRNFGTAEGVVVGIGDDACAVRIGREILVVSTDMLTQRSHFPREMKPRQMGSYAVNANLSDIAAMGAAPLGMVFAMGLPSSLEEDYVAEIAKGMDEACGEHGIAVLGGDTKEEDEIVIVGTAFGRATDGRLLTRKGARVGDQICVTGNIGSAPAGFYCLIKNINIGKFIDAALEPKARVREGIALSKYASSCIDISDGLAYCLHEIAKASDVGFSIKEDAVPRDEDIAHVAKAAEVLESELLFHRGGDYELLFTVPRKALRGASEALRAVGTELHVIGEITNSGASLVGADGREKLLEPRGHEAFTGFM